MKILPYDRNNYYVFSSASDETTSKGYILQVHLIKISKEYKISGTVRANYSRMMWLYLNGCCTSVIFDNKFILEY